MYTIKYLDEKGLFYVEIIDKINHRQIIRFLDEICETAVTNRCILLITDYRRAIIDEESIEPIEKIGLFINSKMKNIFTHIKWANISTDPLPTTGALLLYDLIKGKGIEYQPFTTIEKVMDWMNLPIKDISLLVILSKK
jgi:hypothetical protein